jgi:hypothetical protein
MANRYEVTPGAGQRLDCEESPLNTSQFSPDMRHKFEPKMAHLNLFKQPESWNERAMSFSNPALPETTHGSPTAQTKVKRTAA